MRRRQPLTTILATMLLASALAGGASAQDPPDAEEPSHGLGVTLTCTTGAREWIPDYAGCFANRRILAAAGFELGVALDLQAGWNGRTSHAVGYFTADYYAETWSVFTEFAVPGIPWPGGGDRWRIGFTTGF